MAGATHEYVSPHGINVHRFANDPCKAYDTMKWDHLTSLSINNPDQPVTPNKVRVVCISDTHGKTSQMTIPDGDILLHAGDFTMRGRVEEVQKFADFIEKQPHKHKVVIAGNHELCLGYADGYCDPSTVERICGQSGAEAIDAKLSELKISHPKDLLKGCIYLDNSSASVCGLKIWGSAWTPYFHGWAYNAMRGAELLNIWDRIPTDTDIVVTHGPPVGVGDLTPHGERTGCVELYSTVTQRVKPKVHLFGHIHEGYGMYTDGTTTYINAATCTLRYKPSNPPVVIEFDLPEGFSKDDVTVLPVDSSAPILSKVYTKVSSKEEKLTKDLMGGVLSALKNRFS